MKFRPCIDIHNGKVKQIVGGSLKDAGDQAKENFVSGQDATFYAELYKNAGLKGGHVILLNGKDSEYYEATRNQALEALRVYPGGLQIGGGVCQVSSTMYNAVVKAGLKTTMRRSHTFEPSYVTPGTDATVSWGGPDYKFVNNSSAAIGIRASYYNQTCTVSIYGIPVLEDGVTHSLKSTKLSETDPPAPTYEEDPTLAPGAEKVKSNGSKGSKCRRRCFVR